MFKNDKDYNSALLGLGADVQNATNGITAVVTDNGQELVEGIRSDSGEFVDNFANIRNPGNIDEVVWEAGKRYFVTGKYDTTQYQVQPKEFYDSLVIVNNQALPLPWRPFQRDTVALQLNNFMRTTMKNNEMFIVDAIKLYAPLGAPDANGVISTISGDTARQQDRQATLAYMYDFLLYNLRDGQTIVDENERVAHLCDDLSGYSIMAASSALSPGVGTNNAPAERGLVDSRNGRNGLNRRVHPLIVCANRIPDLLIFNPQATAPTHANGAPNILLRVGLVGRMFRPGGAFRT